MLNFDSFTWSTASSKVYLSPSSLPLMIPAWKGHCLVIGFSKDVSGFVVLLYLSVLNVYYPLIGLLGQKGAIGGWKNRSLQ